MKAVCRLVLPALSLANQDFYGTIVKDAGQAKQIIGEKDIDNSDSARDVVALLGWHCQLQILMLTPRI